MAARVHPKDLGKDKYTSNGGDVFKPKGESAAVFDKRITDKENANLKAYHETRLGQLSLDEASMPNRPSYGDKGKKVTLRTNNMKVTMDSERQLFMYEIVIDDRITSRYKRQHFMDSALRQLQELRTLGPVVATDYSSLLVAPTKMDLNSSDHTTFTLEFYDIGTVEDRVAAPHGKPFKLHVSLIGILSSSDFLPFTDPGLANFKHSDATGTKGVHALNIILASHPNKDKDVYRVGQNKFFRYPSQDTFSNYDLGGGLIAVRGYYCSARFSTSRILLNLDAQCTPFYKTMNVRELVQDFQQSTPGDWPALQHFLWRLQVKTSYMKAADGTPRIWTRRIVGFSHKKVQPGGCDKANGMTEFNHGDASEIKFKLKERQAETLVSVKDYFLKREFPEYGLKLQHPDAIVLNFGTKEDPTWIPAELCNVVSGQACHMKLNGNQMSTMLTIAARPPAENAARIMAEDGGLGLIGVLPEQSENLLIILSKSAFGIKVDPHMIVVPGRELTRPRVRYSKNNSANPIAGASWNMRGVQFVKAATVLPWAMLRIGAAAKVPKDLLEKQYSSLITSFKSCGLKMEEAKFALESELSIPELKATDDNLETKLNKRFVNAQLRETFGQCEKDGIRMLLVILPSEDSWLYDRVKYFGDVGYGVHTVCHQMDKFRQADPMTFASIALKVNLKSGGTNHILAPGDLGFLEQGKTMLVGIDVTHPSSSMKGVPSIAGVVASIDAKFNQFPGSIRCQESRKEIVSELDDMMVERLKLWVSNNVNQKLENVIIYRDGVSEGQYKAVLWEEVPAIREACKKVFKDQDQPKITFIVVAKNHHNRFYPTEKKDANQKRNCNVKAGTVVDRGITMSQGWDFFLVAHEPLSGTAKPAHYVVILNEITENKELDANELDRITHHLCYVYGRATKAVSICPPAYYAHLICLRARCYISNYVNHNWPAGKEYDYNEAPWRQGVHKSIEDSMFYL